MEKIEVREVSQSHAAAVLARAGLIDPTGQFTPESLAASGHAFELTTAGGTGVFVAEKRGDRLWIHGAGAVGSQGMTQDGLEFFKAMAVQGGCRYIRFETDRRGLVRLAKKAGFRTRSAVMEYEIKKC